MDGRNNKGKGIEYEITYITWIFNVFYTELK